MLWNESYNLGIELIDEQHKTLIAQFNALQSSVTRGDTEKEIGNTLKFLVEYTRFHFSSEEDLMEQISYPGISLHKKKHQEFIQNVIGYLSDMRNGRPVNIFSIIHFLIHWITDHIVKEDKKIAMYIKDNNLQV